MNANEPTGTVEDNLSSREDLHRLWETSYRHGAIADQIGAMNELLIRKSGLSKGANVLEVGCGTGENTRLLIEAGFDVVAIDFSPYAVQKNNERNGDGATIQLGDVTALEFPDDAFDGVFCSGLLMHVPALDRAVQEIARVIRPGGVLLLSDVHDAAWQVPVERLLWKLLGRTHRVVKTPVGLDVWADTTSGPLLARRMSFRWLEAEMTECGFRLEHRSPGFFTEFFTSTRSRAARRVIAWVNDIYLRYDLPARAALGQLCVFRKAARRQG